MRKVIGLASAHIREEAIQLLRSQGYRALSQVEKLLDWDSDFGMTNKAMAYQLGLKDHQLKYLIFRKEIREREKKKNIARKEVRTINLVEYQSTSLGFKITAPRDWRICVDGYQSEKEIAKTIDIIYKEYLKTVSKPRLSRNDFRFLADRNFDALKFGVSAEKVGAFSAVPLSTLGDVGLDVVKIEFDSPIADSIELYELDKRSQEDVMWGNRPSRKVNVDGMPGIKYYFVPYGLSANTTHWLKYYNLYLADGNMGWIISCMCEVRFFVKYKPIFEKIVLSFERSL